MEAATALLEVRRTPAPSLGSSAMRHTGTVVLKFGSSVLRTPDDVTVVASEIYAHVRKGRKVVAVVSAFAGETDRLMAQALVVGLAHDNEWLPAYVSQGEERSAVLVAMACDRIGLDAAVVTVRELGIRGEGAGCRLHPVSLEGSSLRQALAAHDVVVAPGFGAVRADGRIGLLGRGGSDTTAAFLAAELGLSRVTLLKDVDGLYDRDPAANNRLARRFIHASWMAARAVGAQVIQPQAIDLAEERGLEIEIAAPGGGSGTIIGRRNLAPAPAPRPARIRVALAGCGVVGQGLLERLLADARYDVTGVLVRDARKARSGPAPQSLFTTDAKTLFGARPEVLLEAISSGSVGEALIRSALGQGIDVISANKQAISQDPAGLRTLAASTGAGLAYSAAVGGGTPMIETMRRAREAGPLRGFDAILNGTVNFVLHQVDRGASFAGALQAARSAGFAEEDATTDLEGQDAAAKLRLLAFEAFGQAPELDEIRREAMDATRDLRGHRQISSCRQTNGDVNGEVLLRDAAEDADFRALANERNVLRVTGWDGRLWTCKGRGAGRWPTVEAMLADLRDICVVDEAGQATGEVGGPG